MHFHAECVFVPVLPAVAAKVGAQGNEAGSPEEATGGRTEGCRWGYDGCAVPDAVGAFSRGWIKANTIFRLGQPLHMAVYAQCMCSVCGMECF